MAHKQHAQEEGAGDGSLAVCTRCLKSDRPSEQLFWRHRGAEVWGCHLSIPQDVPGHTHV